MRDVRETDDLPGADEFGTWEAPESPRERERLRRRQIVSDRVHAARALERTGAVQRSQPPLFDAHDFPGAPRETVELFPNTPVGRVRRLVSDGQLKRGDVVVYRTCLGRFHVDGRERVEYGREIFARYDGLTRSNRFVRLAVWSERVERFLQPKRSVLADVAVHLRLATEDERLRMRTHTPPLFGDGGAA